MGQLVKCMGLEIVFPFFVNRGSNPRALREHRGYRASQRKQVSRNTAYLSHSSNCTQPCIWSLNTLIFSQYPGCCNSTCFSFCDPVLSFIVPGRLHKAANGLRARVTRRRWQVACVFLHLLVYLLRFLGCTPRARALGVDRTHVCPSRLAWRPQRRWLWSGRWRAGRGHPGGEGISDFKNPEACFCARAQGGGSPVVNFTKH